ncbi:MAG: hydrogenase iron-sulfur subunit [Acidobacteria bacterium]|nr:MAG: hydrogenase iron-sulfur subunit [Acidobacteriota bacterium]
MTIASGGNDPARGSNEASISGHCFGDPSFEPKILAILCNWCTYSAADAAGSAHSVYPPNLHIVRVMCSGRVDPSLILKALRGGMDGVLICGCHPGDCHYINGNHKTAFRIPMVKRVVSQYGIAPERIRLEWISAAEANRFVAVAKEMTEQIRDLGPVSRTIR